ncbi:MULTISPECIES: TlpA disulfide reductase family protein [Corynebacterium]|uniref:TlpA family protein disulfide reductase n=1 Tax=Corynebacterium TaxID=1716 RepID=UPI0008A33BCA|nr:MULTISPECIES: TlpA disulfide reductase family protein [Corynebacterium]MBC6758908.1 TlpA family protein disulfide reductase [Corynebacterium sp. LK24]MCT1718608.1 TlpA family protein disulfide reductase [Corynebacterium amycolatum]OFN07117.1 redoxin domain protein [Corynebacterium sp. HMSC074C11]OFU55710.1 redoxin domain protein [Corynebacterium sp. HMSC11H10]OFU60304.1 redoxin domain protein [Corynebacterium sp. HMSC14H10]
MNEQGGRSHNGGHIGDRQADVNRSASLITLLIAGISIVGLVVFAIVNTTGGNDEADGGGTGAGVSAGANGADNGGTGSDDEVDSASAAPAMSKDEIAAVAGSGSLAGVRLPLLAESGDSADQSNEAGRTELVDMGQVVEGKPTVLNVWAWNCAPCRQELPLIEQWGKDNPDVQVVTVHAAREAGRGQALLQEIGVNLPTYSDTVDVVGPALNLPRVVPITVVFKADGTVATIHPGEFIDAQQITDLVRGALK